MTHKKDNRFVSNIVPKPQEANYDSIFDYENLPVLTLEETVEKLIAVVPDILDDVSKAKEKCNQNSRLTHNESAAIYLYSMSKPFFSGLNAALRGQTRHALKPWLLFLKLIITALEKLPSMKATLWRGVSFDATLMFVDDDVYTWWCISSCTADVSVVQSFLGESGTLFAIEAIHGKDIVTFAANPDEKEVILMPGTRVRARNQALNLIDRFFIVHLEEIDPQGNSTLESSYLFEQIRQEYLRNSYIERIMNPSQSFPIEQSYINLAILEAKEQQGKERQLHGAHYVDTVMDSFERIYATKTVIDIKDIFITCKTQEKQVLVFGRAGIGKSTFCRYIAYQWATGSYWSQYELLALIPLRHLTSNRYPLDKNYSLIDLVKKELFQYGLSEKEEELLKKQFNMKKTLWILDGYDEIVQNIPPHLESLFKQLLKTPHHIITSRPFLNTLSYEVQLEITGFTDKNINGYVQQFFDQMTEETATALIKSQKLLNFLKLNPSIWGIAHIPVNLELICSLSNDDDSLETGQLTITALYSMMTEWLCRCYITSPNKQILSKNEVDQHCQKELTFLECLAFNAMEANAIIIRPPLLKTVLNEVKISSQEHRYILNIGILKSFEKQETGIQVEKSKDYYFIHLSLQEYFAARYLVNALKESPTRKAIDFIKHQRYNQRYALVFTFVSGLVGENETNPCLNIFWDTIVENPLDLVGIRHMQLVISCIEEISDKSTLPRRTEWTEWVADCIKYSLSRKDDIIRKHLTQFLQKAQSVACDEIIINIFINLLQYGDTDTKIAVLLFVSELKLSKPSMALITSITNRLDDENQEVSACACEALKNIGDKTAINEVISTLIVAPKNESENVIKNASKTLRNTDEIATTNEVINKLVSALRDKSKDVRANACYALANIGEKAATNEVINKLLSALEDESACVRRNACYALGNLGEKAATNVVIRNLITALEDKNDTVKANACYALGNIGAKAATNEMINKLISTLEDESAYIRRNVCYALGNIGEKAATDEVIRKLITALEDENDTVKANACYALGNIGEKAATNEITRKLINALGDESKDVRANACYALGNMGEKAATNEVIGKLISALEDGNENVKANACYALGNIGVKITTDEAIRKLTSALEDESAYVRRNACYALGNIGEKAVTNEMISRLASIAISAGFGNTKALDVVANILSSPAVITQVAPKIIADLCLCKYGSDCLKNISEEELIDVYLTTKNPEWLSAVTLYVFLKGAAITVIEEKIVLYGRKEPLELLVSDLELRQQLIESITDQAQQLHLSPINVVKKFSK